MIYFVTFGGGWVCTVCLHTPQYCAVNTFTCKSGCFPILPFCEDWHLRSQMCFLQASFKEAERKRGRMTEKERQNGRYSDLLVYVLFEAPGVNPHSLFRVPFFFPNWESPVTNLTTHRPESMHDLPLRCLGYTTSYSSGTGEEMRVGEQVCLMTHRACCVLPGVTVKASMFGSRKLNCKKGWGLAKEINWYRRGHFTQHRFQDVIHQTC